MQATLLNWQKVGWIDGWSYGSTGLQLDVFERAGVQWVRRAASPDALQWERPYESSLLPRATFQANNVPFEIADLSVLPKLLNASEVSARVVSGAKATRHAIYVIETPAGRIYLPALLLVRALWMWSPSAFSALITPGSLDLYVARPHGSEANECSVSKVLVTDQPSDVSLRRVAWLAQNEDAGRSWGSVLSFAHQGKLDLALPRAALSGWVWGVQVGSGLLACELMSPILQFELAIAKMKIRVGRALHECPVPALPPNGLFRC